MWCFVGNQAGAKPLVDLNHAPPLTLDSGPQSLGSGSHAISSLNTAPPFAPPAPLPSAPLPAAPEADPDAAAAAPGATAARRTGAPFSDDATLSRAGATD